MFTAYDLILSPDINQLTQLTVCEVYKVNNHLQTFEKKTTVEKNNTWFTRLVLFWKKKSFMQYFYCIYSWVFVYCNVHLFSEHISELFFRKSLANPFCHRISILDIARVLNPQYPPAWTAYTDNLLQEPGER